MATKPKAASKSRATASNAVDRQLARYREMRDFKVTAEPSGKAPAESAAKKSSSRSKQQALPFVIQKHAASHLHYDFRLGWNGVLKSWAVTKGPSYVTADKRLAVQVEDHPMEYGGFEGIIPKGQYGGGTVMVWDQGTWEPQAISSDVGRRATRWFTEVRPAWREVEGQMGADSHGGQGRQRKETQLAAHQRTR